MEKTNYKKIPNCLRKYRKARGFKQKEVARLLGIKNTVMISRWETGYYLPDSLNMFKLASIYRVMVDALFIDLSQLLREDYKKKEQNILKSIKDNEN